MKRPITFHLEINVDSNDFTLIGGEPDRANLEVTLGNYLTRIGERIRANHGERDDWVVSDTNGNRIGTAYFDVQDIQRDRAELSPPVITESSTDGVTWAPLDT